MARRTDKPCFRNEKHLLEYPSLLDSLSYTTTPSQVIYVAKQLGTLPWTFGAVPLCRLDVVLR